jgi:hypothetical protein
MVHVKSFSITASQSLGEQISLWINSLGGANSLVMIESPTGNEVVGIAHDLDNVAIAKAQLDAAALLASQSDQDAETIAQSQLEAAAILAAQYDETAEADRVIQQEQADSLALAAQNFEAAQAAQAAQVALIIAAINGAGLPGPQGEPGEQGIQGPMGPQGPGYVEVFVAKTATQTVTSSAVLVNDTELFVALLANEKWMFEFYVVFDASTSGDIKFSVTGPAGATAIWSAHVATSGSGALDTPLALALAATGFTNGLGAGTKGAVLIKGYILNDGNAGNLRLQWAQNAANATPTNVFALSHVLARKVA